MARNVGLILKGQRYGDGFSRMAAGLAPSFGRPKALAISRQELQKPSPFRKREVSRHSSREASPKQLSLEVRGPFPDRSRRWCRRLSSPIPAGPVSCPATPRRKCQSNSEVEPISFFVQSPRFRRLYGRGGRNLSMLSAHAAMNAQQARDMDRTLRASAAPKQP